MCVYVSAYICMYMERERERKLGREREGGERERGEREREDGPEVMWLGF